MVKLHVLKPRLKHDLFFIPSLVETILSYCQYEDAKEVYKHWRCDRPEKPILSITNLNETIKDKFISCSHDTIYVIYQRGSQFDADFFLLLANTCKVIKWQCPSCKKYSTIEHEANGTSDRVIIIQNIDILGERLARTDCMICDCSIEGYYRSRLYETITNILDLQKAFDYHLY